MLLHRTIWAISYGPYHMCEFGRIHSTDELLESRFSQQETVCKKVFCIAGKIFRNNDRVKILVIRIFSA